MTGTLKDIVAFDVIERQGDRDYRQPLRPALPPASLMLGLRHPIIERQGDRDYRQPLRPALPPASLMLGLRHPIIAKMSS